MAKQPLTISFKVPSERAIAAEMAASNLGRMQAINRIRQRDALRTQFFGRRG